MTKLKPPPNPLVTATNLIRINAPEIPVQIKYPRASSISNACMRLHVLAMFYPLHRQNKFNNLPSRIAFSIGNAYHYWMQNSPDIYGQDRYGWWKCLGCGRVDYFGPPPEVGYHCRNCSAMHTALEYMEHPMYIKGKPWYLSGHPDLYLGSGSKKTGYLVTNELKSIKNSEDAKRWDWSTLVEPLADHKYQIMAYMMGAEHDVELKKVAKVDPSIGNVSYIAKGNFGNLLPIKTFEVERRYHKDIEEAITEKLLFFSKGLEEFPKNLPSCQRTCVSSEFTHYSAKACPGLVLCQKHSNK